MRLIFQLGAIVGLLASVVLSIGSLRDVSVASERSLIAMEQASLDGRELACCRTITPDQRPLDEACRRVWADGRRRFFGLDSEVGEVSITSTRAKSNPRPTGSPGQKE